MITYMKLQASEPICMLRSIIITTVTVAISSNFVVLNAFDVTSLYVNFPHVALLLVHQNEDGVSK